MQETKFIDCELYGAQKVMETRRKEAELLKESEVVKEYEGGRKMMRDKKGRIYVHNPMTLLDELGVDRYGYAVKCEEDFNEENIEKAKEIVLEKMFEIIRDIAKTVPDDFFVIKSPETWKDEYRNPPLACNKIPDEEIDAINYFTVGCKLFLPKVYKE